MNKLKKFFSHLDFNKELYLWAPLVFLLPVAVLYMYLYLTGSSPEDDGGYAWALSQRFFFIGLSTILLGMASGHIFADFPNSKDYPWQHHAVENISKLGYLGLVLYFLFR